MDLKEVTVGKSDTCLTYALKRIGSDLSITDVGEIENYFEMTPYADVGSKELVKGDLLLWTNAEQRLFVPNSIDKDGFITFHNTLVLRHLGVYEGNGKVSDCTRRMITDSYVPAIRMRYLKEIKARPQFLLRTFVELK